MTSNYFDELKSTFEDKIGKFAENRDSLRKQTVKLREKISDTENHIQRLEQHGKKLDECAGESLLSGSQNDYAKFQTALKKNYTETEVAKRELSALKSALETTQKKFLLAERNLNDKIKSTARELLPKCQERVDSLLDEVITEFDNWVESWERLCGLYGESFSCSRNDLTPHVKHSRINGKLGLVHLLPIEERIERLKKTREKK